MLITVDSGLDEPLFAQIADAIRSQAAAGAIRSGTKLPSARELAEQLDVNLHTVLKAYQLLRDEGLVELRRGRGAILTAQATKILDLAGPVDSLLATAAAAGVGVEGVVALLRARAGDTRPPASRYT